MATAGLVAQYPVSTFVTPVNGASPIDANTVRSNDNVNGSTYTTHDADGTIHLQSSTLAARPAFGTLGRKWLTTDGLRLYYDTGAAWSEVAYLPTTGGSTTGKVSIAVGTTTNFSASQVVSLDVCGLSSLSSGFFTACAIDTTSDTATSGSFYGAQVRAFAKHSSGTTATVIAFNGGYDQTVAGGTVTNAVSLNAGCAVTDGTTTTMKLLRAPAPTVSGTGAIGTLYGLHMDALSVATTNWAIYLASSTTSGGVTFRDTALATGATVGHFFVPSCAGTPTGVPTTIPTGQIAMHFDSTNNFLYAYLGGAWKKTTVFA